MTLTDFLVAKCLEALEAAPCDRLLSDGWRVGCDCKACSEAVEEALRVLGRIRCCEDMFGSDNVFLRLLADKYATDPSTRTNGTASPDPCRPTVAGGSGGPVGARRPLVRGPDGVGRMGLSSRGATAG